ncbi:MAG: DUF1553 domain-containing protein [Pirellulaceae bacterium]
MNTLFNTIQPWTAHWAGLIAAVLACSGATTFAQTQQLSFKRDVRPILSNHCFACHGPDQSHREADMRLDVAGKVDLDQVLERITSSDPDFVMPPPKMNKPLKPAQIETLNEWVKAGAQYEEHWAFIPPQQPHVPTLNNADSSVTARWSKQPIDRFVLASLMDQGLGTNERADRRTLIRRVTLDLTGLPPTIDEIEAFLDDDSNDAYVQLVERLLGEAAYGEHMARYWLDLVRFADTNGLHHDHYREMTPYRDWVIRSFNNNLPFNDFITYQLAGDLFQQPTTDQLTASGFNRLHLIIDVGTALPEESFFRNVVDQVSAVGTAFMGLTMQCAVCHDHKYDPITQRDFYQLSAFFNNFDGTPETGGRNGDDFKRGLQPPYINLPSPAQAAELEHVDRDIESLQQAIAPLKKQREQAQAELAKLQAAAATEGERASDAAIANAQRTLAEQSLAALEQAVASLTKELEQRQQSRSNLLREIPAALVMKERAEIRPAHIMIRGQYDQPGEQVTRGTPAFLPPLESAGSIPTRMDLANWLTDRSNPLTARVTVNRFWQQLFGVGLVKTSEDFGSQGESPSHPELLDYLATRFVESGWDVKDLMRSIVLSEAYCQSSMADPESFKLDPNNRRLARGSRFRLDAEVIRDQLLSTCGLLNRKLYGTSVKPPQPAGLWETVVMPSSYPNKYEPDTGSEIYRRSVYTFWKRAIPPPQMTIFDAPTRESCIARRERTNTPLQALLLMNESQHFAAAMHFAGSLLAKHDLPDARRLELAFETITSRELSPSLRDQFTEALSDFSKLYTEDAAALDSMLQATQSAEQPAEQDDVDRVRLAAWTMVVHAMLNLDQTKTRE